jgi:hypothetical protein
VASIENLNAALQAIEDDLVLKSNYSEELEMLNAIESDIAVFRYLGTPVWKCTDLRDKIKSVREWMIEEMARA